MAELSKSEIEHQAMSGAIAALSMDPRDPDWADRDRFILSAGHGSMLLYSLLHLTGYKAVTLEQIKNFRQLGSNTAGHP